MPLNKKQTEALFRHISSGPDGPDLLDYLEGMAHENYRAFLQCEPDMNEAHKGIGATYQNLIDLIVSNTSKLPTTTDNRDTE